MAGKKAKPAKAAADASSGPSSLPEHLRTQHDYVTCGVDVNFNTQTASSATRYMALGVDNSWVQADWERAFRVEVTSISGNDMDFDLLGLDPSIANAFRRILIAETPTMAIEHVFFVDNTSIIADEVLAHRLGLIPVRADPSLFEWKSAEETANEKNTLVFKLKVACRRDGDRLTHDKVYSSALEWLAGGSEMPEETNCRFVSGQAGTLPAEPAPVHPDILLAKMRPGQAIELEAHCVKGVGREHAKWSPVATAWYKLLPELHLLEDIVGGDADKLAQELPELVSVAGAGGRRRAVAAPARNYELLLEKARRLAGEERWEGRIALRKRKDHFLFTVQSTGVLPPDELFIQAVDGLAAKADKLLQHL